MFWPPGRSRHRQTGTGKTAAFVLPMLTHAGKGPAGPECPHPDSGPTRELAAQVKEQFRQYGGRAETQCRASDRCVSFGDQDIKLTRGVDVLIATLRPAARPYRARRTAAHRRRLLVIDEADRMLTWASFPTSERICKMIPFTRQDAVLHATMPPEIRRITETFLHNPEKIEVSRPRRQRGVAQFQVGVGREPLRSGHAARLLRDAKDSRTRSSSATASAKSRCCTNRCRSTASASVPLHGDNGSVGSTAAWINSARAKFRCWCIGRRGPRP